MWWYLNNTKFTTLIPPTIEMTIFVVLLRKQDTQIRIIFNNVLLILFLWFRIHTMVLFSQLEADKITRLSEITDLIVKTVFFCWPVWYCSLLVFVSKRIGKIDCRSVCLLTTDCTRLNLRLINRVSRYWLSNVKWKSPHHQCDPIETWTPKHREIRAVVGDLAHT